MGYKILLADDSVTVQKIITLTFSDEGVDVLAVNNGDEALHRLQYLRPALVMADVSIPGKNGYEICEFVKNHPDMKDTPVVLLVPAFEPFDEERARRIGADQHLTKPFQSIRTLIATVKGLLEAHPPKISTPLSTGPLNNYLASTGRLSQPVEVPPVAPVEPASLVAEPDKPVFRTEVPSTRPFPDDSPEDLPEQLEEEQLASSEAELLPEVAEDVPVVEAPLLTVEPEPEPVNEPVAELVPEPIIEPVIELETEPVQITDAVAQADVKVLGEAESSRLELVQPEPIQPEPIQEEVPAPASVVQQEAPADLDGVLDLDHVLDLDDVLAWPPAPQAEPSQPAALQSASTAAAEVHESASVTIPQTVIDEIVNRVVAQLSEKLTAKLASHLAPEVIEMVKQQTQHEPVAQQVPLPLNHDSDALLDLD